MQLFDANNQKVDFAPGFRMFYDIQAQSISFTRFGSGKLYFSRGEDKFHIELINNIQFIRLALLLAEFCGLRIRHYDSPPETYACEFDLAENV